jgi:hypothetical protein
MEEEIERENPLSGAGATPSMGLSQFRGGRKTRKSLSKKMAAAEAAHPSLYIKEMDEEAEMPSGEYDGAGAHSQGAHLARHIKGLRGGAFLKDFASGLHSVSGAGYDSGKFEGEGKMEGGFLGALASIASTAIPLISSLFGRGQMSKEAHDELMKVMKHKKKMRGGSSHMVGAGKLTITHGEEECSDSDKEAMLGKGRMRKPKRPVAASDGRRKRAEIVRKVMAEKGLSMIEASKYVKAHGLY